jgi:hypothetical protein
MLGIGLGILEKSKPRFFLMDVSKECPIFIAKFEFYVPVADFGCVIDDK